MPPLWQGNLNESPLLTNGEVIKITEVEFDAFLLMERINPGFGRPPTPVPQRLA